MKVGDIIWRFDFNVRKYTEAKPGRLWGDLIYSAHWKPVTITGETRVSWLVERYKNDPKPIKVPKKGPHRGFAFTLREVELDIFRNDHTRALNDRTAGNYIDPETFVKVARVVGIEIPESLNDVDTALVSLADVLALVRSKAARPRASCSARRKKGMNDGFAEQLDAEASLYESLAKEIEALVRKGPKT